MKLQKLILPSLIGLSLITVVVVWRSTEPELSEVEHSDPKLNNIKPPKGSLSLPLKLLPSTSSQSTKPPERLTQLKNTRAYDLKAPSANPNTSSTNTKAEPIDNSHLSPTTLSIISKNPKASFPDRLKAVQSLTKPNLENREALYSWMLNTGSEKVGEIAENAIRNDLLNSLIQMGEDAPRLQSIMVHILEDKNTDLVWRDYMLQHMPIFEAKHLAKNPSTSKPEGVDQTVFLKLAKKYSQDLALSGTALIAWGRLLDQSKLHSAKAKTELTQSAWVTASSKDYSSASRTTALQILADHKDSRTLKLAKDILKSSPTFTLKLSAIAVLGRLGGKAELSLLAELPKQTHLNRVTQKAVQNIKERHKI